MAIRKKAGKEERMKKHGNENEGECENKIESVEIERKRTYKLD